ncbi:hypothetical protein HHA01_16110 [Halomonas halmophila]|uniref:Uncharacterized protein n=1 Tax=Halomonas halmophila TaxID=252 RepID=A0A4Y4F477_9GAMM|nr:hypothetical protein HHA01_16110 [Halomonas halmophila]
MSCPASSATLAIDRQIGAIGRGKAAFCATFATGTAMRQQGRGNRAPGMPPMQVSSSKESKMKRKPDLVMVLVLLFGVAVVVTGYAQALAGN